MTANRELLELAAKAAGLPVEWDGDGYVLPVSFKGYTNYAPWNPLTDDGDALRLAVKLLMTFKNSVERSSVVAQVEHDIGWHTANEPHGSNPYAATRRAIVRAAAEIGRAMQ